MVLKMVFKVDSEGDLWGTWRATWRGTWRGNWRGTSEVISNRTWNGTYCQAQVSSRSDLVQVRFSLQRKFNSLELDSEVM